MAWFTSDTIGFFRDLEENNNREWFEQNRKRYETYVKTPMLEFAAEMIQRMRKLDSEILMEPRQALFRINRDTRFSKDKSPYKTNAGLVVSRGKKHEPGPPGLYFHLDKSCMAIAGGCYFLMPEQIMAIRSLIAANLDEFERLLNEKEFRSRFGTLAGEKNKKLPGELQEAAAKQPLLYNKQFFYWTEHEPKEALREDLPDFLMAHIIVAQPMNAFLSRAL